jgi:hypothetical protein
MADPTAIYAHTRLRCGARAEGGGARRRTAAHPPELAEMAFPTTKSRGENAYA